MTKELKTTIQNLYQVFSIYPQELAVTDLEKYSYKAMTTWGKLEDFKHFLPQIFEKMAQGNFGVDHFIVLGKLNYGHWEDWPHNEREAIQNFLVEWWKDNLAQETPLDMEQFKETASRVKDISNLLAPWGKPWTEQKLEKLTEFVVYHLDSLEKDFTPEQVNALKIWLKKTLPDLEEAFFAMEGNNPILAKDLSLSCEIISACTPERA